MTVSSRLVIFTRFPAPGLAKTRLIPLLGADGAARLHKRLTERAVAEAQATGLRLQVRTTGAPPEAFGWLGDLDFVDQGEGDLGARMARVFAEGPAMVVGSDIPGMTAAHLLRAATLHERHELVLGPAEDGGYWLIAMKRLLPELFAGIAWGASEVLAETRRRARLLRVHSADADTLRDLDMPYDLAAWPELLA
jgi:rSAM/selenodomain-associated transferase 1